MKLLHSLLQRQIVRPYSAKNKQVNVDFMIEAMKCHKDDKHDVKGLDTEAEVPPFACSFNNSVLRGHMLAVADEEGGVCLYDVRKQGSSAKLKGWVAHSNAIFDIAWVCNEPKLVTASGDQTAQLWDIQQSTRLAVFKGHSCSLKSVDFQDENLSVFATGARDGNVMVWDIRCNKRDGYYKPVNTIHNCHSTFAITGTPQRSRRRGRRLSNVVTPDSQQSVTSVIFQDVNTVISAGAVDGNIKVWDLRKNYSTIRTEPVPYHVFPYPASGTRKHGYSSLTLDSTKSKLFANCTNDVIYMYDCITYQKNPLATFRGHSNATFYVKSCVSPDDQYLFSGSGDCDGYIWRIDDPTAAPFHLTGHTNEVTSVAWCPTDQTKVVTCSDDNSWKVWRVNNEGKNNGDFVGWCERKPNPSLPFTEAKDNLSNKTTTLQTSPIRSQSDSTPSSPISLSAHPIKQQNSPQQLLQNWLQPRDTRSPGSGRDRLTTKPRDMNIERSACNKRQRDTENTMDRNKRVCLDKSTEENGAKHNGETSSAQCETSLGKELSTKFHTDSNKDSDKENVDINSQINSEQSSVNTKSRELSEKQSNIELKDNGSCSILTSQSDCKNATPKQETSQSDCKNATPKQETDQSGCKIVVPKQKSNWLRDMGVKKNKMSRKIKPPSQPSSPQLQEPRSPNTDVGAVLKNTRSIRDYFAPLSRDEDSPSKYCLR